MVGRSLGHYKILSALGAGGMGEVYLAEDSRLKRNVAIKVLPAELAADAHRLARLQREAQLLAALNHPNVAAIYGFDREGGTAYLAMELVEGRGLDEMVATGPLARDEALELAAQIAAGLEAAHERGIIHRDLKPANVRVTADDQAKVLDFGLAKGDPAAGLQDISPELSASPTVAVPTMAGVILGTAAYMSPEQARGKPLDRRTDIWSFGCVLFEMITGKRPFGGETVTDLLAAVVKDEPDWEELPAGLPWRVHDLLRRCFRKDPRQRLRDIGDARLALREAIEQPDEPPAGAGAPQPPEAAARAGRTAVPWVIAAVATALTAYSWLTGGAGPSAGGTRGAHLTMVAPPSQQVVQYSPIAVSPRGGEIVYAGSEGGPPRLYRRGIDDPGSVPIPGTENGDDPLFSPDGRALVFSADNMIRIASMDGGPLRTVCNPCDTAWGMAWTADGSIVFSAAWSQPLSIVSMNGGPPRFLTQLDPQRGDITHVYPQLLPDGRVLFTIWTADGTHAAVTDPADGSVRVLHDGGLHYRYAASGHLLYVRDGTLLAAPFDLASNVTGASVPIVDDVFRAAADGFAAFAISDDGILAYRKGDDGNQQQPMWIARDGTAEPALELVASFDNARLSPDGQRVALSYAAGSGFQVSEHDLEGRSRRQLTRSADNLSPVYSPDGSRLLLSSTLMGGYSLLAIDTDGAGEPERLIGPEAYVVASDWWGDGTRELVVFHRRRPETDLDVWLLERTGDRREFALAATSASESGGAISADGRWVAYVSAEGGVRSINVVATEPGAAPIVLARGTAPRWNPADDELLYFGSDGMVTSQRLLGSDPLRFGPPAALFPSGNLLAEGNSADYDLSRDGQRFFALQAADPGPAGNQIQIVLDAFELLERLAPTGR